MTRRALISGHLLVVRSGSHVLNSLDPMAHLDSRGYKAALETIDKAVRLRGIGEECLQPSPLCLLQGDISRGGLERDRDATLTDASSEASFFYLTLHHDFEFGANSSRGGLGFNVS